MGEVQVVVTWSPRSPKRTLEEYCRALREAGANPIVLVAGSSDGCPPFDALLLPGGADVHPKRYRQAVDPRVSQTLEFDEVRDEFELAVVHRALEKGVPILGICRGLQLLNVALGGSLVQDLSLLGVERGTHNQRGRLEPWQPAHHVRVLPGSHLHRLLGVGEVHVNSFHQAVAEPAPGLTVAAWAPDGVIEAMEDPQRRFLLGVQWHPERMVRHDRLQRSLFAAFVRASRGEGRGGQNLWCGARTPPGDAPGGAGTG